MALDPSVLANSITDSTAYVMCACVFVLFEFSQEYRDKAVAKLDFMLLKQCSVCAWLFGYHHHGNALSTGTLSGPLWLSGYFCAFSFQHSPQIVV